MLRIDPAIFTSNLIKTQQYCHMQMNLQMNKDADTASVFRSFNSTVVLENVHSLFPDQLTYKENYLTKILLVDVKYQGEIVISRFDETVVDGASEVTSAGLFDLYDIPPIDTWFYLTSDENGWQLLFAWIPQPYMHYADEAIAVNCVDCIGWFKDWYPEAYEQYYLSVHK